MYLCRVVGGCLFDNDCLVRFLRVLLWLFLVDCGTVACFV